MSGFLYQVASSGSESSYLVLSLSISQSGTSAPTAVELENTLNESYSFSYDGVGAYFINFVNPIFQPGTYAIFGNDYYEPVAGLGIVIIPGGLSAVTIRTFSDGASQNNILNNTFLEIRVY